MRSFFKLPGTVFIAVAALFAVVASTSTANAMMLRDTAPVATALTGPESVEKVAISRWDAWRARRDVARSLREDCRDTTTRRNRGECFREARSEMRNMRHEAHAARDQAYNQCRQDGGSRRYCRRVARQAARAYWVDATTGDGGSDDSTGEPPRSDD